MVEKHIKEREKITKTTLTISNAENIIITIL